MRAHPNAAGRPGPPAPAGGDPRPQERAGLATPKLDLTLTARTGVAHAAYLRRHVRAAHALLPPVLAELSVALVGDKRMADLHVRFMGVPGPTDVLTFPLDVDRGGRVTAGEVVICVPEAARRAATHGVRPSPGTAACTPSTACCTCAGTTT